MSYLNQLYPAKLIRNNPMFFNSPKLTPNWQKTRYRLQPTTRQETTSDEQYYGW